MNLIGGKFRAALLMGAAASMLMFAGGAKAQSFGNFSWLFSNSLQFGSPSANDNIWPYAPAGRSPVLAVVGDIACQPGEEETGEAGNEVCTDPSAKKGAYTAASLWQSQEATANEIETLKPDAVALLGDLQYQVGRYSDFEQSFDLTYGAFKFLQRPAPGNHEFYDEHGETGVAGYGYFSYFNGFLIDTNNDTNLGKPLMTTLSDPCPSNPACGPGVNLTADPQPIPRADGQAGHFEETTGVADGWYSYDLGSWHLISLNIECSTQPGGCSDTGSWLAAELAWLKKDLQQNHSACTLAYWHQPTFSATNGITPEGVTAQAFWQLLYQYGADLVLNGHDHLYARYRPLTPTGKYDPINGIRQFTVGTGGETLDPIVTTPVTSGSGETNMEDPTGNTSFNVQNLQAYSGDYWGVMALRLDANGYAWDYESALQGPVVSLNGPTSPTPTTSGYSDKGVGLCHGPANW
jgi:acid phosphatase type 7